MARSLAQVTEAGPLTLRRDSAYVTAENPGETVEATPLNLRASFA